MKLIPLDFDGNDKLVDIVGNEVKAEPMGAPHIFCKPGRYCSNLFDIMKVMRDTYFSRGKVEDIGFVESFPDPESLPDYEDENTLIDNERQTHFNFRAIQFYRILKEEPK